MAKILRKYLVNTQKAPSNTTGVKLPCVVRFVDTALTITKAKLAKGTATDRALHQEIEAAIHRIESNAFSGVQIPKRLIPKEYFHRYAVKNLWKYNLSNGWRLLYTIESDSVIVVSIVLEWASHKEYERRFKY